MGNGAFDYAADPVDHGKYVQRQRVGCVSLRVGRSWRIGTGHWPLQE